MEAELKALIKKHLPEQLGATLQEHLADLQNRADKYDRAREVNKVLTVDYDKAQAEIKCYLTSVQELDTQLEAAEAVIIGWEEREAQIHEREITIKITEIAAELCAEREAAEVLQERTMALLRNVDYRASKVFSTNQAKKYDRVDTQTAE